MKYQNSPSNIPRPWASEGSKNVIPTPSQTGVTAGAASWSDGFPPLTMTPIAAGGVPPSGLDMNGALHDISGAAQWAMSGAGARFDANWAALASVNGYAKGARVLRADGTGYWMSTRDDNRTDPDAAITGDWRPIDHLGVAQITASGTRALTVAEYGRDVLRVTSASAGAKIVFPANSDRTWQVINNTNADITATTGAGGTDAVIRRADGAACITTISVSGANCYAEFSGISRADAQSLVVANPGGSGAALNTVRIQGVTYSIPQPITYRAGSGISISGNTISSAYQAGNGISISGNTISAVYQAGTAIAISGRTISGNYQAGNGIAINGATISGAYRAGAGIAINGATISGAYQAGTGIAINGNTISCTLDPNSGNDGWTKVELNKQGATNNPGANGWVTSITVNDNYTGAVSCVSANPGNAQNYLQSIFINGQAYQIPGAIGINPLPVGSQGAGYIYSLSYGGQNFGVSIVVANPGSPAQQLNSVYINGVAYWLPGASRGGTDRAAAVATAGGEAGRVSVMRATVAGDAPRGDLIATLPAGARIMKIRASTDDTIDLEFGRIPFSSTGEVDPDTGLHVVRYGGDGWYNFDTTPDSNLLTLRGRKGDKLMVLYIFYCALESQNEER